MKIINSMRRVILLSKIESERNKIIDLNLALSNREYDSYIDPNNRMISTQNIESLKQEIVFCKNKIKQYEDEIKNLKI